MADFPLVSRRAEVDPQLGVLLAALDDANRWGARAVDLEAARPGHDLDEGVVVVVGGGRRVLARVRHPQVDDHPDAALLGLDVVAGVAREPERLDGGVDLRRGGRPDRRTEQADGGHERQQEDREPPGGHRDTAVGSASLAAGASSKISGNRPANRSSRAALRGVRAP